MSDQRANNLSIESKMLCSAQEGMPDKWKPQY
jgi:hypothetical protein